MIVTCMVTTLLKINAGGSVIEYLQKQKIQLTRQQKVTIEQPPSKKFKSFFKARATPSWATILSEDTNLVIPQSEKIENQCSALPGFAEAICGNITI